MPAPAHVGQLIEQRLNQLNPSALRLARLAALAGQNFSVELAAQVLGRGPLDIADDWRELEAALIIRDDAFAHDLIFEATLRSVPAAIARALHRDIAARLQQSDAAPAHVARHWSEAGEWSQAATAWVAAARAAKQASRRGEEADGWDRAIDCFERAGDSSGAFEARFASLDAVLTARPIEAGFAVVERLERDADTQARRLDACLARADASLLWHRSDAALAAANEALALARRLGLLQREFDATRSAALALAQGQRAVEALELLRPLAPRRSDLSAAGAARTQPRLAGGRRFAVCASVRDEARSLELIGAATTAQLLAVDALARGPSGADAAACMQAFEALAQADPHDLYRPEAWWILHRAFGRAGEAAAARDAFARAACWIRETALPHVPDEFRDAFLHRHPVNRAVLAAASRPPASP